MRILWGMLMQLRHEDRVMARSDMKTELRLFSTWRLKLRLVTQDWVHFSSIILGRSWQRLHHQLRLVLQKCVLFNEVRSNSAGSVWPSQADKPRGPQGEESVWPSQADKPRRPEGEESVRPSQADNPEDQRGRSQRWSSVQKHQNVIKPKLPSSPWKTI